MQFSEEDQSVIINFLDSKSQQITATSKLETLWGLTSPKETLVIRRILTIDPKNFGFRGEPIRKEEVPDDLVQIKGEAIEKEGEAVLSDFQYMPKAAYDSFVKMNESFTKTYPNRKLLVESSYRSQSMQIVTMLYILAKIYNFDLSKTLKRVAFPDYSQHCSVSNTAVDIMNIEGSPADEDPQAFKDTVEYTWLKENANNFMFYESYPENNPAGIMWEPWHWQFRP